MRPRPKKSSAHAASNATRRILRQCHFATPYGSPMALRDTIRLTYGASRHTARATPMAPLWGRHTAPPHGYALVACGNAASIRRACALCSRCLRQRGEHTRALKAPHLGAFFAYGAPLGTPYGSFSAYGSPLGTPYGYVLVACGNAANICRALLIACSPRFVAGTNGSGIRGVVQIVP